MARDAEAKLEQRVVVAEGVGPEAGGRRAAAGGAGEARRAQGVDGDGMASPGGRQNGAHGRSRAS